MSSVFQQSVRTQQTAFFTGNIVKDGPIRSNSLVLNTQGPPLDPVNNLIGNAFTYIAGVDGEAQAGGAAPLVFAGILVGPNQYSSDGTTTDPLAPTLLLSNGMVGDILYMGIISIVLIDNASGNNGTVGDYVVYNELTGALSSNGLSAVAPVGAVLVPNAQITGFNLTTPGLAEITLLGGQINS